LVEVFEQTFENYTFVGEQRVWKNEIWKLNYVHIPDEYWMNESPDYAYYINLIGFNADNEELIRTRLGVDKLIGNPFQKEAYPPIITERGCGWTCNGPNWAWHIQQWKTSAGSSFYILEDATVYNAEGELIVNYYEYMTVATFNNMANNINGDRAFWEHWYGISYLDWGFYSPPNNLNSPFHKIPNDGSYKDKLGHIILVNSQQQEVVRVHKGLGWWRDFWEDGSFIRFETGAISNPASQCVFDRTAMIDFFINNSNITEYLDPSDVPGCDNNMVLFCPVGPVSGGDEDGGENCTTSWLWRDWNGDNMVNGIDFFYYFVMECDDTGGSGSSSSFLTFENISDKTISFTELVVDDFFNENGEFTQPTFTIDKGLIRMNVIMKGGQEKYVVFENNETIEGSIALSSFLNVIIYPVPLQGDDFTINIMADAKLDFTYEMFDFQGNLLHSTNYSVEQWHNEDHLVQSDKPIPSGLILNRFTFRDGSILSITTTKN